MNSHPKLLGFIFWLHIPSIQLFYSNLIPLYFFKTPEIYGCNLFPCHIILVAPFLELILGGCFANDDTDTTDRTKIVRLKRSTEDVRCQWGGWSGHGELALVRIN
jgi:hypothetical protein